MAPSKTKSHPHKSNNHKRYLADDATKDAGFTIDLNANEVEGKELQIVNKANNESDFEGFGSEGGDKDGESEDQGSDAGSVQIDIEGQKNERVIPPKDAEEEELERLIFGDSAGFRDGLENFSISRTAGMYGGASDEEQEESSDLDQVADDNLFFFDTGPEAAPAGSVAVAKAEESEEEDQPAWDDSDDERLVISLASVPQLRKLRETAEDDMVNGKEYARRLRKQYERLYPAPEWAAHATGKTTKRRRTMDDDEESGEESGSDMDVDDDLSTQPLARLLKDADILSRNTARGPAKRRKLQAGTIDIQRLKDVAKAGPVRYDRVLTAITILTTVSSPRSPRSLSTPRILSFSRLDPAQRSRYTTSTPTHRTPTHSSHLYTSSAPRLQRPLSIHRPPIRAFS